LKERLAAFMGEDCSAQLHIFDVPVGVITMVVGIENEADGLVGSLTNRFDNLFHLTWEISIDDQNEILENHPALIATRECWLGLGFSEKYAFGEFEYFCLVWLSECNQGLRTQEQKHRDQYFYGSSHDRSF